MDGKLELQKVDAAMNSADVCTKALLGNRIRELCRLARVSCATVKGPMGDDPNWMSCADVRNSNRAATLSPRSRPTLAKPTLANPTS